MAVDATATRLMGLAPERIGYLQKAGYVLGNLRREKITQIGESLEETRTPFEVLEEFRGLMEHPRGGHG